MLIPVLKGLERINQLEPEKRISLLIDLLDYAFPNHLGGVQEEWFQSAEQLTDDLTPNSTTSSIESKVKEATLRKFQYQVSHKIGRCYSDSRLLPIALFHYTEQEHKNRLWNRLIKLLGALPNPFAGFSFLGEAFWFQKVVSEDFGVAKGYAREQLNAFVRAQGKDALHPALVGLWRHMPDAKEEYQERWRTTMEWCQHVRSLEQNTGERDVEIDGSIYLTAFDFRHMPPVEKVSGEMVEQWREVLVYACQAKSWKEVFVKVEDDSESYFGEVHDKEKVTLMIKAYPDLGGYF